jgi:DNA-binding CsgD family transcriptional regulator
MGVSMNTEQVPRVFRRAFERGWTNSRIAETYGCVKKLKGWRAQLGLEAGPLFSIEQAQTYLDAGHTIMGTAEILGVSHETVRARISTGHLKWSNPSERRAKRDAAILARLAEGYTGREVAKLFGLSPQRIQQIRKAAS